MSRLNGRQVEAIVMYLDRLPGGEGSLPIIRMETGMLLH